MPICLGFDAHFATILSWKSSRMLHTSLLSNLAARLRTLQIRCSAGSVDALLGPRSDSNGIRMTRARKLVVEE